MAIIIPPKVLKFEDRLCGVLLVVLMLAVFICIFMVTRPLLIALWTPSQQAVCEVDQLRMVEGVTNCSNSWASCQDSCTVINSSCKQVYVYVRRTYNETSVLPLYANVLGCGYDLDYTCPEFYKRFSEVGENFSCLIYLSGFEFATPEGVDTKIEIVKYLFISLTPVAMFLASCGYMMKRNMFTRGYKKAKKLVRKKSPCQPRSFYQRKMLELEFKKNLRDLKMKNTHNDVKIFDLENAQTAGVLILKPQLPCWIEKRPNTIV